MTKIYTLTYYYQGKKMWTRTGSYTNIDDIVRKQIADSFKFLGTCYDIKYGYNFMERTIIRYDAARDERGFVRSNRDLVVTEYMFNGREWLSHSDAEKINLAYIEGIEK